MTSAGFNPAIFNEVNHTHIFNASQDGVKVCDKLFFEDTRDDIRIDVRLMIPSDSRTGALSDVITASANENTTA